MALHRVQVDDRNTRRGDDKVVRLHVAVAYSCALVAPDDPGELLQEHFSLFFTGLFLVIIGFLVQWPTLLTVLMAPVLLYAYVRLARSEERHMLQQFGEPYREYMQRVPAFFPPWNQWMTLITTPVPDESGV